MTVTNAELKTIIQTATSATNTNFQKAKVAINGKVDKVSGKGLSTNDFTTTLKNKLDGVASGAQVNVIETVKVNGTAATVSSKTVDITIPASVSYTIAEAASTTSGMLKTYVLKADGVEVSGSKIDIPKDYLLKSATIKTCSTANSPENGYAVGDPYLDFVFNTKDSSTSTGDTHQYVNLKGLIDTYVAGSGITVSNHTISVDSTVALKTDLPTKISDLTDDALSGYSKASSVSAVSASDTLPTAIGKLEKALDGKQASGSYSTVGHTHTVANITDFPTIPAAQIQSDWNQSDNTKKDYIKNKPTIPTVPSNVSSFTNDSGYQTAQNVTDAINTIFGSTTITDWDSISLS